MTHPAVKPLAIVAAACLIFLASALLILNAGSTPQSASAGDEPALTWGDIDCDGGVNTVDALKGLRDLAAFSVSQEQGCPEIGSDVGSAGDWGDWDCDEDITSIDQLQLLRHIAGLSTSQAEGCPDFGGGLLPAVTISELTIEPDWQDFGDAPDGTDTGYASGASTGSFPTQTANDGPSHPFPFTVWLGEFATMEPEPYVGMDADDGLQFLDLAACDDSSALVVINRGGITEPELDDPVYANLLADWNRDGDWSDEDGCASEWAVQNELIDLSDSGPSLDAFAIEFTGGDQVDEFWLRLVVSREPFDPTVGGEFEGETEDYFVSGGDLAGSASQPSSPVTQAGAAGNSFICKGTIVPHNSGALTTFEIEQTKASIKNKFTPRSVSLSASQPLSEDGKAAGGVSSSGLSVNQPVLTDGRLTMRVTTIIQTTEDGPDRLAGPFIITINLDGTDSKDKPFSGSLPCAFYVDHSDEAGIFIFSDGFFGGPGRAAGTGETDPKFLIMPHGKKKKLLTDGQVSNANQGKKAEYDKSSLTVFDGDGNSVDVSKLKELAGLKKIRVPTSGRGIIIATAKDDRDPPVERIVVRLTGKYVDGGTFIDYYRVFVIHEKGAKARKLVTDLNEKFALITLEEDEPFEVAYTADGQAILSVIPPSDGLAWDVETDCVVSSGGSVRGIMHGSRAFIFDYDGGGSDIYLLPDPDDLAQTSGGDPLNCPGDAINVTNWQSFSQVRIERGNRCDSKFYGTEISLEGLFNVFEVGAPPSENFPIPVSGGDDILNPNCFSVDGNGTFALVGSTPGDEDRSNLVHLGLVQCGGTCTQSSHEPTLLLEAENPGEHLINAAVSPDKTKIAFQYFDLDDDQVYVADFDPLTPALTNAAPVTSEGNNGFPTWSPDSQQLAFLSDRDGNFEIYVMNADGSDQQNITNTPDVGEFDPSWMTP